MSSLQPGLDPKSLNTLAYTGPSANIVSCSTQPRRPTVADTNYPILHHWQVGKEPQSGSEGEIWVLEKFTSGEATWGLVPTTVSGSSVSSIGVDTTSGSGTDPVLPSGAGLVTIGGTTAANSGTPVSIDSALPESLNVVVQVAKDRTGAPGNRLDAGLCSFSDADFVVDANGYVELVGGVGNAVLEVQVDANTAPGTDPVVPTGLGVLTINGTCVAAQSVPCRTNSLAANNLNVEVQVASDRTGAPVDKNDAGVCSFNDTQFTVDTNGYVTLSQAGLVLSDLTVDTTDGSGVNPVVTTATGGMTFSAQAVAQHSVPIETISRAANSYSVEAQYATTTATSTPASSGLSHYYAADFAVNSSGFVSLQNAPTFSGPGASNLGITYDAGTGVFKITSKTGAALSATNPARITLQDKSNLGYFTTITVTADQSFIDDNGASEIIGNQFGTTTGVAYALDRPFFIYAVVNDAANSIQFMLSDNPCATTSPASASIGMPSTPAADSQGSFWSLDNITATSWDLNPCVCVGSFRMRKSVLDDWTVQTLSANDGIGKYNDNVTFQVPFQQFGSAANSYIIVNGGTVPTFAAQDYYYTLKRDGWVDSWCVLTVNNSPSGAQEALLVVPYKTVSAVAYHTSASVTLAGSVHSAASFNLAATDSNGSLIVTGATATLTNADWVSGYSLRAAAKFQAF